MLLGVQRTQQQTIDGSREGDERQGQEIHNSGWQRSATAAGGKLSHWGGLHWQGAARRSAMGGTTMARGSTETGGTRMVRGSRATSGMTTARGGMAMAHDDGGGRREDGKGQQGNKRHNDDDGRHNDVAGRRRPAARQGRRTA